MNKTDFADSGTYTAVIDNGIEKLEVPVKMNVGGNETLSSASECI